MRTGFACGVETLDRYLKLQASQDARKRVAVTYVLVSTDDRIAGYYTLSSDNLRADDLAPELIKQLKLPRYPVMGATLIGRLARDQAFLGHGIGELLLIHAFKTALDVSRNIASIGIMVDAKNETAIRFYTKFGFLAFPDSPARLFIPMQKVESLFE